MRRLRSAHALGHPVMRAPRVARWAIGEALGMNAAGNPGGVRDDNANDSTQFGMSCVRRSTAPLLGYHNHPLCRMVRLHHILCCTGLAVGRTYLFADPSRTDKNVCPTRTYGSTVRHTAPLLTVSATPMGYEKPA